MVTGAHFLHNVSFFANLSLAQLEPLAQRLVTRKYREGELIFGQGSPGNSLYIVKSGLVEIVVTGAGQSAQTLAQFGPGQVFGEFALLDGLPRSAGAVARARSELLILTRPEFFIYLEQNPAVAINLLVLLSRRLRFTLQQTEHTDDNPTPTIRLARILVDLAERYGQQTDGGYQLAIRLTLGELAGIMSCPRSEAEAALGTLQERSLVSLRGLQIIIRDLDELRTIAAGQG